MAEDLLADVNKPKDINNLTDLEKKHLPVIEAPDEAAAGEPFEVTIEVGKLLAHPNEPGHHIEFIDLYLDRVFVARVDLAAVKACPRITLPVALSRGGVLRAFACCNLHGVWEGTREIAIKT